jgi:hypothetical protein
MEGLRLYRDGEGPLDDLFFFFSDDELQAARGQRTQDRDDTDSRQSAGGSWSTVNSSTSVEDWCSARTAGSPGRASGSDMGGSGLSGNVLARAEKYAFSLYLSL